MSLLYFLEILRNGFLDVVFGFFTLLGEETVVLPLLCLLYWCWNKRLAYQVCFVYFLSGLGAQFLKIVCRIPRPWVLDPGFSPVPSALETATGYSFPSGHTQSAGALWGTLGLWEWRRSGCRRKAALVFALALPAVTGLSRMYLGVHTPWDVLAGYLLSLAVAFWITRRFADKSRNEKASWALALLLFVVSLAVTLTALILIQTGFTPAELADDCCKAGAAGMGFALGWYWESNYIRFSTQATLPFQALKLGLGLAGALAIRSGLKLVLGGSLPSDLLRYFLLVLWVMVLYPLIIRRLFPGKSS